jgi:hypothetical protein
LLDDNRFADYFADRLARGYVGVEGGQFVVFRRDRFTGWLSEQLRNQTPYDEMVRTIIAEEGLWTGVPATNFITSAVANGDIDENKLAGRAVRAFLGQRIDCAQCHDHPFDKWKQADFEGLAAQFGQVRLSVVGVEDKANVEYTVEDRQTLEKRSVAPSVPFHPEWLPQEGTRRQRLAGWITHPENRRFERAIANRVWGLMFGSPYTRPERPVDDIPDPGTTADSGMGIPDTELLDILGRDFREHGCDLRRLIQLVAASRPFRLASTHASEDPAEIEQLQNQWALFPIIRLRPEQVIGAMLQATSVTTIDQNTHLLFRTIRYMREKGFVNQYGDLGENELEIRAVTIPQTLLKMNGNLSRELSEANPFSAAGRILAMAPDDSQCIETCYLVCLTRRPVDEELAYFTGEMQGKTGNQRTNVVEDLIWTLYNSPEFSLNH